MESCNNLACVSHCRARGGRDSGGGSGGGGDDDESGCSGGDDDDDDEGDWVQCDACNKWRRVSAAEMTAAETADSWGCWQQAKHAAKTRREWGVCCEEPDHWDADHGGDADGDDDESGSSSSGGSGGDDDDEGDWVQCDACDKWRRVSAAEMTAANTADSWGCWQQAKHAAKTRREWGVCCDEPDHGDAADGDADGDDDDAGDCGGDGAQDGDGGGGAQAGDSGAQHGGDGGGNGGVGCSTCASRLGDPASARIAAERTPVGAESQPPADRATWQHGHIANT